MRVLHIISGLDPENGGPTTALAGLTEAQVRAGLEVSVLSTWQIPSGFPLAERLRENGVGVKLVGKASGKLSRHPELRCATEAAVRSAEVVHVHAIWEQAQHEAAVASRRQGVPYIVTPHGMLSPWSRGQGKWFNRWGKRLYLAVRARRDLAGAAAVHFTTAAERDLVAELRLGPRSIVEPVGIDFAEFESLPERGRFRAAFPAIGDRPLIVFLGRMSPQKGLDRLIPAFAECVRRGSKAMLAIVGPDYDGYGRLVRQWVGEQGVESRVLFTGMLQGARRVEALRDADLMALPSHHENFGIVVAEAMACATPVVVSRQVNVWQEVEESGGGSAVSGEVGPLAGEMMRWLADEALRRAAGERGRDFARRRYDWSDIARRWIGHYAAVSGEREAPAPLSEGHAAEDSAGGPGAGLRCG